MSSGIIGTFAADRIDPELLAKLDKLRAEVMEDSPPYDRCETCRFSSFGDVVGEYEMLFCRRYPPVFMLSGSHFSPVRPNWWCGEFKPGDMAKQHLAQMVDVKAATAPETEWDRRVQQNSDDVARLVFQPNDEVLNQIDRLKTATDRALDALGKRVAALESRLIPMHVIRKD